MTRYFIIVAILLTFWASSIAAQEYEWAKLNGPYWVNGIDVAVGDASSPPGYRYLIGTDNSFVNIFRWSEIQGKWIDPENYSGANKIISYKTDYEGYWAFCSVYDDDVYRTINSGQSWGGLNFDGDNPQFSCVEIANAWGDQVKRVFSSVLKVVC